jgi:thiol-disulfide isomerase/thioredoxin
MRYHVSMKLRLYIFFDIFLAAAAALLLSACAPKSAASDPGPAAPAGSPGPSAGGPAPLAASATATLPGDALRDRLMAAGLGVPKEPIAADDFELASLTGGTLTLSALRGSFVFLNFWATWCPPCRGEMPSMERLYQKLGSRGLEIVAVDLRESQDQVRSFVRDNRLSFRILLDSTGSVGGAWGAQSIPTTYLIDRKGGIVARAIGGREWDSDEMVALFETLLADEPGGGS